MFLACRVLWLAPPLACVGSLAAASAFLIVPRARPRLAVAAPLCRRLAPMDRLVFGDVGFGKTEMAIRAALLAVRGGRQVAVF